MGQAKFLGKLYEQIENTLPNYNTIFQLKKKIHST